MRANCPSPGAPMRSNETEYPRECSDSPVSQASTLESRSTKSNATRTIGSPNYCEYLRREYVKNVATNMTVPFKRKVTMKVSTLLDSSKGFQQSALNVVEMEKAGLDLVWVGEAYG